MYVAMQLEIIEYTWKCVSFSYADFCREEDSAGGEDLAEPTVKCSWQTILTPRVKCETKEFSDYAL